MIIWRWWDTIWFIAFHLFLWRTLAGNLGPRLYIQQKDFYNKCLFIGYLRILGGGSHIFDLYQKCFLHNCKMGVIPTISTSLSLHLWLSDDAFSYCSYFLIRNFQIFSYTKFSHIFLHIKFTYFLTPNFHTLSYT